MGVVRLILTRLKKWSKYISCHIETEAIAESVFAYKIACFLDIFSD